MKKNLLLAGMLSLTLLVGGVENFNEFKCQSHVVQTATVDEIKQVQQKLKQWGYYTGNVDGVYGSGTRTAIVKFQKSNGLEGDGILGTSTANALGMKISNSSIPQASGSDLQLLAKCIYAEARGEPYQGQVAVGAVILNRVENPDFPNTVAEVIYQPWAFTAVHDGQINFSPDSSAYSAAQDALNGWDPTYGCVYYYNTKTATSDWIFNRKTVVTIGRHVFAV